MMKLMPKAAGKQTKQTKQTKQKQTKQKTLETLVKVQAMTMQSSSLCGSVNFFPDLDFAALPLMICGSALENHSVSLMTAPSWPIFATWS